jgi:hypothetical protein
MNLKIRISLIAIALTLISPTANAESDPFPGVSTGAEIPGTRVNGQVSLNCSSGSGSGIEVNATTHEVFTYCVKTWRPTEDINADANFRAAQDAAVAAATLESQAWNAANPGKQKCVQWGPIIHANGVSTASGGVCANPVQPGAGTTVASETTTSVAGPTDPIAPATSETVTAVAYDPKAIGSGGQFTKILPGQHSTSDCPAGYQAANGIIVAIGTGTFTECWPANAWNANRLGGDYWNQFVSSGGTYDIQSVIDQLAGIATYKSKALVLAQSAADLTPGIQRCSSWSAYGQSGQECAYAFIKPTGNSVSDTSTVSDTKTVTDVISELAKEFSNLEETSTVDSVDSKTVELQKVKINTTLTKINELIKTVATSKNEIKALTDLSNRFSKLATSTIAQKVALPQASKVVEKASSLTPNVCTVKNLLVEAQNTGRCTISYSITGASGNTFTTKKTITFKN